MTGIIQFPTAKAHFEKLLSSSRNRPLLGGYELPTDRHPAVVPLDPRTPHQRLIDSYTSKLIGLYQLYARKHEPHVSVAIDIYEKLLAEAKAADPNGPDVKLAALLIAAE